MSERLALCARCPAKSSVQSWSPGSNPKRSRYSAHRRPPLLGETGVPLLLRERRERDEHVAAFLDRHPVRVRIGLTRLCVGSHRIDLPGGERILPQVVRRVVVGPPLRRRVLEDRTQRSAHELRRRIEEERKLGIEDIDRADATVRPVLFREVEQIATRSRHELARRKALPPRKRAEPRILLAPAAAEGRGKRLVLLRRTRTHRRVGAYRLL